MFKKTISFALAAFMALALFAGCSSGGSGGDNGGDASSGSAASQGASTADDGEVFDLNVNVTAPETVAIAIQDACSSIEEKSEGRIKFTIYFSNSLLAISEIPKGLQQGLADVSNFPSNNFTSLMPLNTRILQMPFMGIPDMDTAVEIYNQLLEEFPEMQAEYENLGMTLAGAFSFTPYRLHFTGDKEVRTPSDLNGLKILTNKVELAELISQNGGAPITQPPSDWYSSLEKNVADGLINNYTTLGAFGLTDLISTHVDMGQGGTHLDLSGTVISTATLERMPEDLRQLMIDEFTASAKPSQEEQVSVDENTMGAGTAKSDNFIELTDAELQEWVDAALPLQEATVQELEKDNPVARDIYNRCLELISEKA